MWKLVRLGLCAADAVGMGAEAGRVGRVVALCMCGGGKVIIFDVTSATWERLQRACDGHSYPCV